MAQSIQEYASNREPGPLAQWLAALKKKYRQWLKVKVAIGGTVVFTLIFVGLLAPWITPYDPNHQDLLAALQPPRIIYGARISLVIAATVVLISGVIGVGLGAISGYFGARTDFFIQKAVEVVWAFPPLLLAIAIIAFMGQGLEILIIALIAQRWIPYCRVARGQSLSLRTRDFVTAARSLGATHGRIIGRHILPNLLQSAMVIGTFAMASAIISEASLSFLGLGVPPEIPTWGSMLADGREHISTSWWLSFFPGICIFMTVLGINLLGDALRDILDPRLKRAGSGIN